MHSGNTYIGGTVGDLVRGGNVLGEEGFFCNQPVYKETVTCSSDQVGLLVMDAQSVQGLGLNNFAGKGIN